MTASCRFTRCPDCGQPVFLVRLAGQTLGGHACTRPEQIVSPGPGVQVGRHLGALANTSSQREDDTGFSDGRL